MHGIEFEAGCIVCGGYYTNELSALCIGLIFCFLQYIRYSADFTGLMVGSQHYDWVFLPGLF